MRTRYTHALTVLTGPTLWYDLAECGSRDARGMWQGHWAPPPTPEAPLSPDEARKVLADHPLAAPWLDAIGTTDHGREPDWTLWHVGPAALISAARELLNALARVGQQAAVYGSLAMYLQTPFRLSPDIDVVLPKRVDSVALPRLVEALTEDRVHVSIAKESYIGGTYHGGEVPLTVDIEAGGAYERPLSAISWNQRKVVCGLSCLTRDVIVGMKRDADRPKDRSDVKFLEGIA